MLCVHVRRLFRSCYVVFLFGRFLEGWTGTKAVLNENAATFFPFCAINSLLVAVFLVLLIVY